MGRRFSSVDLKAVEVVALEVVGDSVDVFKFTFDIHWVGSWVVDVSNLSITCCQFFRRWQSEKIEITTIDGHKVRHPPMNIFVLHPNPRKAARYHVDKHVRKMILETCQLLYTAHWALFYPQLLLCRSAIQLSKTQKQLSVPEYMLSAPVNLTSGEAGYRPCHIHHPCNVWTRESLAHYRWLAQLGKELAREYRYRFGKTHASEAHVLWLAEHPPLQWVDEERPSVVRLSDRDFAIAMDDEYKISSLPVVCYRHYYRTSKKERGLIEYTRRVIPHWIFNTGV